MNARPKGTVVSRMIGELVHIERLVARNVCDLRGTVTRCEADRLLQLRRLTGLQYDAVNEQLLPWSEDE